MSTVIQVDRVSKQYRLGQIGGRRLVDDVNRRWARFRGKEDPLSKIDVTSVQSNGNGHKRSLQESEEQIWALKDVSFEVKEGEVVGIIGRNGAGKSTLLKILSRVTAPTSGEVRVKGRIASLLEVGTGFHPELTGRENIFLNGAILGMTKAEIRSKFDEIVAFSEIEKFIDTPVKRYSSGMYVRLAFAVAAHLDPEILIVDEVLAVGDAAFQKKCLGKMGEVARVGRTVLFVSHNMAAVTQLCSRALWLNNGTCSLAGHTADVVQKYLLADAIAVWERSWSWPGDAPGDDRVRLLGTSVLQHGETTGVVDINEDFELEIRFAVLRPCRNLITGFNFYNFQGTCLFSNCDWRPNQLPPGLYRKRVSLPSPLLAEGVVSVLVQLVFYDPLVESVILPDLLSFDAVDTNSRKAVRGRYTGSWPGLLRPSLNWSNVTTLSE
jgi:lipopolysaccharide transport system ATP-binding protein